MDSILREGVASTRKFPGWAVLLKISIISIAFSSSLSVADLAGYPYIIRKITPPTPLVEGISQRQKKSRKKRNDPQHLQMDLWKKGFGIFEEIIYQNNCLSFLQTVILWDLRDAETLRYHASLFAKLFSIVLHCIWCSEPHTTRCQVKRCYKLMEAHTAAHTWSKRDTALDNSFSLVF